jgi:hypothetical protein
MLAFLALTIGATFATAARSGAVLHGHMVQSINHHLTRNLKPRASPGTVATFAFYGTGICDSSPYLLQAQNTTCYGPIARQGSFQLIELREGCQGIFFSSLYVRLL